MPRPTAWAFTVEVLTSYSHPTQTADLRLCHTAALTNPVCPETERVLAALTRAEDDEQQGERGAGTPGAREGSHWVRGSP